MASPRPLLQLVHVPTGSVVAGRVEVADTMWTRMKGLLGRESLEPGAGLWITPCDSIHMFWMKFPIDALFLGRDLKVAKIFPDLAIGKAIWPVRGAKSVVELPAGSLAAYGLAAGDQMEFRPAP